MNPIDTAVTDLLSEIGDWQLHSVSPQGMYEEVGAHGATWVAGYVVTIRHGETDTLVTAQAGSLGNALALAVRKVATIKEEQP